MSEPTKIILRAGESIVVAWPDGETQLVVPRGVPVFSDTIVTATAGGRIVTPEPEERVLRTSVGDVHDLPSAKKILDHIDAWRAELAGVLRQASRELPRSTEPNDCPHCRAPYVPHVTGCVNGCGGGQRRICSCVGAGWGSTGTAGCPLCGGSGLVRP